MGFIYPPIYPTLDDKLNVTEFGATGNGVTDDTTAIIAATVAASAQNKRLYFPAGTYLVTAITVASSVEWVGEGKDITIIKRKASSATGLMIGVTAPKFLMMDMSADGNKANQTNGGHNIYFGDTCLEARLIRVLSKNAKANAGYGDGLYVDSNNATAVTVHVEECIFTLNDGSGADIIDAQHLVIQGSNFTSNTASGLVLNNYDATFTQKIYTAVISGNVFEANTASGCIIGSYIQNNNTSAPVYGQTNPDAAHIVVSNNIAINNGAYGFSISGLDINVNGNVSRANGSVTAGRGGILFNARLSTLNSNMVQDNTAGFGIDAGGCDQCVISNNIISNNGTSSSNPGLNLESTTSTTITGNYLSTNGQSSGGSNIYVDKYGAAGVLDAFTGNPTSNVNITANLIVVDGTRYGIYVANNSVGVSITDNKFTCSSPSTGKFTCVYYIAAEGTVENNILLNDNEDQLTPDGSGNLIIPDIYQYAYTNSSQTLNNITTSSVNAVGTGIAYITMTNGGTGYTSVPTVTFTGGGGSGAAATAIVSNAGVVMGVRMTAFGTGYGSAPTIGFSGGGGSSAAATATWKLPLRDKAKIKLQFNTAALVTRAGTITVENPTFVDIYVPAQGFLDLFSQFGRWQVAGKNTTNHTLRQSTTVSASTGAVYEIMGVGARAAGVTITLPAPNAAGVTTANTKFYRIKDESGEGATKNITVVGASGNIDGAANYVINTNYGSVTIYSDGTNYFTLH